jgi:hypothetical protein
MRIARLVLLGVVCYLIAMVVLFPAAPVVDRIRPQLGPVALEGVSGRLFSGRVARVASTDDLLPLEASNLRWRLAPTALLSGGGAKLTLDAYGGETSALVKRSWAGNIEVQDLELTARAKELEPLLPAPIAAFDGDIAADVVTVLLENNLLTRFEGEITWSNAVLERPVAVRLGNIRITVVPNDDGTHAGTLNVSDGDVDGTGDFTLASNGDYTLNMQLTPAENAPADVVNNLRTIARADAQGRYTVNQSGNVNRLM